MKNHITRNCPFEDEPHLSESTVWLKPFLVCEVKYTELTREGVMRHASFQGLREDKAAFELNDEKEQDTDTIVEEINEHDLKTQDQLISKKEAEKTITLDGHPLKFTNLKKIFWLPGGFAEPLKCL